MVSSKNRTKIVDIIFLSDVEKKKSALYKRNIRKLSPKMKGKNSVITDHILTEKESNYFHWDEVQIRDEEYHQMLRKFKEITHMRITYLYKLD